MTTTLTDRTDVRSSTTPAERLRTTMAAVRLSVRWLGVRKTLTPDQINRAAEPFGAEGEFLSARKKLLDTRHPAYKEVTAVRGRAAAYWRCMTLPFPEAGIRLIRQNDVEALNQHMHVLRDELHEAVAQLDRHYAELKASAMQRLGRLYNPADYPPSLDGLFDIEWDFPSVEPPDYLMQLNPAIYEQERMRVAARFEEAVRLGEQAFISEFTKLVSHLAERLSGNMDGKAKTFRNSALTNVTEFFGRFRQLNVRSNEQLDALVEQAHQVVQGIGPQELRDSDSLRQQVATELTRVQSAPDDMLVDRPRRNILRKRPREAS